MSVIEATKGLWPSQRLGAITQVRTGKLDANAQRPGGPYPFFTCGEETLEIDNYAFDTEAILLAGNGNFNVKWYKGKFNAYQRTYVIEPIGVNGKWLFYAVQAALKTITKGNRGSVIRFIRISDIVDSTVRVPPPDEQLLVVAEIEKQFTRLDAGVAALKRVQANLKRYRAAVLKAACEGKLVRTEGEIVLTPLKELIQGLGQGWSPKCILTREAEADEWAIITTTAVQAMCYLDNQGKPLPPEYQPRPHLEIKVGDFLMTRKGPRHRAGVSCLVRSTRPRLMVCDTVYRFRAVESRVIPSYLELALNSPSVVQEINRLKAGISESGVSLTHDKIGGVLIPLPPLSAQSKIVAEVERFISVVDAMESVVQAQLLRAGRLRQSVLATAFRGELV